MLPGLEGIGPHFVFADEMGYVADRYIHFSKQDRRSDMRRGMPFEDDLMEGRQMGFRYCNIVWLTHSFDLVAVDYLDLNKYFWSK